MANGFASALRNLELRIGDDPHQSEAALMHTCIILAAIERLAGSEAKSATHALGDAFAAWYGPDATHLDVDAARSRLRVEMAQLHRVLQTH